MRDALTFFRKHSQAKQAEAAALNPNVPGVKGGNNKAIPSATVSSNVA
jgi:hypothetical protein